METWNREQLAEEVWERPLVKVTEFLTGLSSAHEWSIGNFHHTLDRRQISTEPTVFYRRTLFE
jgi:hypothetical protein